VRALVSTGGGVHLEDRADPAPSRGEALLRVRLAGICNTDLEIARGYMGYAGILGHEILGEVIGLGPDTVLPDPLKGARVAAEINCACLACATCSAGLRTHCPNRSVLGILGKDGGLAEYVAVPIANLHAIPSTIPDERAVFIEPLAAALHAFDEAAPKPGDRVLLLGDGKLGLLIGLALASRSDLGEVIAAGRHREKLAILERAGLAIVLEKDLARTGFDLVIEATGHSAGLSRALAAVRPKGTIVLKSTYAGESGVDLAPIVINEIHVVGSRCGSFPRAIEALAKQRIDPSPLISETHALENAEHAFARAADPGVLKVLIRP